MEIKGIFTSTVCLVWSESAKELVDFICFFLGSVTFHTEPCESVHSTHWLDVSKVGARMYHRKEVLKSWRQHTSLQAWVRPICKAHLAMRDKRTEYTLYGSWVRTKSDHLSSTNDPLQNIWLVQDYFVQTALVQMFGSAAEFDCCVQNKSHWFNQTKQRRFEKCNAIFAGVDSSQHKTKEWELRGWTCAWNILK